MTTIAESQLASGARNMHRDLPDSVAKQMNTFLIKATALVYKLKIERKNFRT